MDPIDGLSPFQIGVLACAWAAYGVVHSTLASNAVKRALAARWPGAMRAYRILFNLLSTALLVPPLWLTFSWRTPPLWQWTGAPGLIADGLALAAFVTFLWSCRHYDMDEFSGLGQWRSREAKAAECGPLRISPLHRHVRHPWYFLALVMLWTRDMDEARLVATLCITLYFWAGSRLEERKLIACHGEAYARYRERVPALVPLPWRRLGAAEARELCNARGPSGAAPFPQRSGRV